MQFNDTVGGQGLVQDALWRVGLDATTQPESYPLDDLVRNANNALDAAVAIILGCDGRWQFDDSNYTTLPIATTDLVNLQKDYTYAIKFLEITRMEIKDTLGNWRLLKPFDQNDLERGVTSSYEDIQIPGNISLTDYLKVPGQPILYDKMGESIILYPTPNYSQLASLKAYFKRKMDYFVAADTVKEPGFRNDLHQYVSVFMAYEYAKKKTLPQLKTLFDDKNRLETAIVAAYSRRNADEKPVMRNNIRTKI